MSKKFNEIIFGKNDIRGKIGEDFSPELYEFIAKAYVKYIKSKKNNSDKLCVSVARDARNHSEECENYLIKGLKSSGADVISLGLCPSPLGYYSEYTDLEVDGTLVVTASHNPSEYNGLKMTFNKVAISEDEIQILKNIVIQDEFEDSPTEGSLRSYDIISDYIKTIGQPFINKGKGLKVVVDSGNATGGVVAPDLYRKMGVEVIELFSEPDGDFPNHHPNPSSEKNLADLKNKVLESNADFGIAFDGDSDRIGVVDNRGYMVPGDQLMLMFALDILEERKDETPVFVSEVKCSQVLYDTIEKNGGRAIMWKTGHGFIKSKMKQEKALMAGEMSGHVFFKDRFYGFDDAVYAGCRFIEVIAKRKAENSNFKVSDFIESLPQSVTSPEVRKSCPNEYKYQIVEDLKAELELNSDHFINKVEKLVTIDGIRIVFNDGFALVRASNTEPVFTMRFEAGNEENLKNYKDTLIGLVDKKMEKAGALIK